VTAGRKSRAARPGGTRRETKTAAAPKASRPACGLCGKRGRVTRTECCGQWICDDEDTYVLFSYARNSCSRNHRRYTLCGYHAAEEHTGDWRTCQRCRRDIIPEMYVYYGTNEYNFVKLETPPRFEPTRCTRCRKVIRLAKDAYSMKGRGYYCERCSPFFR
jgi:hypothetical protein